MTAVLEYEFEINAAGERLDLLVYEQMQALLESADADEQLQEMAVSRSKVASWVEQGYVKVNCEVLTRPGHKVKGDVNLLVSVPPPRPITIEADSSVSLNIAFEDDQVLVIDKQAGQVVHPGAGHWEKTLVNGLLAYLGENLKQVGDALRPGIVHRLDKDTSGLMVVAKTEKAYQNLLRQFLPPKVIERVYLGVTYLKPERDKFRGSIELPIGRHPQQRMKMAVVKDGGKTALTHWEVVEELKIGYLLRLRLETGRTHQIRVHLKALGAALVGDPEYGTIPSQVPAAVRKVVLELGRQALHAAELCFNHPTSGKRIELKSELPEDMRKLLDALR